MLSLSRELVLLMIQFLEEENFKETAHRLEVESGFYFNMRYFEELVKNGEWDEVVKYMSAFTKVEDNRYSMKIFFEIQKQKYLEALDRKDSATAVAILVKDLKVFSGFNDELFKEIALLLTLENFRENEQLSKYGDVNSARVIMLGELKKLIEANPALRDKLTFPNLRSSRLRTLINQSLNWQHQLCKNPKPHPDIKTLFVDHCCGPSHLSQPNSAFAQSPVTNPLLGAVPRFPPLGVHGPFPPAPGPAPAPAPGPAPAPAPAPAPGPLPSNLTSWMANQVAAHPSASAGQIGLVLPNMSALSKRVRTPPASGPAVEHQTGDPEHVLKRTRASGPSDEVCVPVNVLPVGYSGQSSSSYSSEDLPKAVVMTLNQSSSVKSMDFHPLKQSLLLVGTNAGDFSIWDLGTQDKLAHKNFKIWDLAACSATFQSTLTSDYTAAVNRVTWSPDGTLLGVAYSKNIVQIYSYHGDGDIRNHLEIEAHNGSVNDLAFSLPNQTLSIVTCGDDRLIKVWNAVTGEKENQFEGHEAPVYCVCPHFRENIQFIFSTATDGSIKVWLYDNAGPRLNYSAPGHSPSTMAYSYDGTRLFSCGTNKEGQSFIVEWNEAEGSIKQTYIGLGKRANRPVQFDTTKNRYIVAGDEWLVKYWNMDNASMLMAMDADGGLPASPCVRFNKEGILLAVSTNDNGIKILANSDGVRLLKNVEKRSSDASRIASSSAAKITALTTSGPAVSTTAPPITMTNNENQNLVERPRIVDVVTDRSRMGKVTEITEPSHFHCIRLPDNTSSAMRVRRLMYTNSGLAVLALAANAVHKLWKWPKTDNNSTGKATASVAPQMWQPPSGILMTNDISDTNTEDSTACVALSKNDSYCSSASGGKISLFNMMTFKVMTTFMSPPPAATFLVFHPLDNNMIAVGMDDCSIHIYNVRVDEVKTKLIGHYKRVTGLAFSTVLKIMVSAGADSQLCVWTIDGWEKQSTRHLYTPGGRVHAPYSETHVQFHQDQIHLLVVHETQIAIFQAPRMDCLKQWGPREATGAITHAAYSCDSQTIYVTLEDGSIDILSASTLRLRCRISPASYLPSNPVLRVFPVVVAAHPTEPNQFAIGLTDGGVCVLEPLESEGKWGGSPGAESGAGSSSGVAVVAAGAVTTTATATNEAQR